MPAKYLLAHVLKCRFNDRLQHFLQSKPLHIFISWRGTFFWVGKLCSTGQELGRKLNKGQVHKNKKNSIMWKIKIPKNKNFFHQNHHIEEIFSSIWRSGLWIQGYKTETNWCGCIKPNTIGLRSLPNVNQYFNNMIFPRKIRLVEVKGRKPWSNRLHKS